MKFRVSEYNEKFKVLICRAQILQQWTIQTPFFENAAGLPPRIFYSQAFESLEWVDVDNPPEPPLKTNPSNANTLT